MATCYRCGRPIPSTEFKVRRRVQTGEWIRRRYPHPQINAFQIHYGIRVVCSQCARAIDWETAKREYLMWLELCGAIALLAAALFSRFLS